MPTEMVCVAAALLLVAVAAVNAVEKVVGVGSGVVVS